MIGVVRMAPAPVTNETSNVRESGLDRRCTVTVSDSVTGHEPKRSQRGGQGRLRRRLASRSPMAQARRQLLMSGPLSVGLVR